MLYEVITGQEATDHERAHHSQAGGEVERRQEIERRECGADARLLPIGGGTQEIMKEIIAKQLGL